ncbi:MAG: DUF6786 family protein [Planctomycetota bacterium]
MRSWPGLIILAAVFAMGCSSTQNQAMTFGEDLKFLQRHTDVIVLGDLSSGAQIAVVPAYQGRVMTSTHEGEKGMSFGWINKDLIAGGKILPHINAYGGEDRFWMGPEGGQFAIFFPRHAPFDFEHWQTPSVIDTEPFELTCRTGNSVSFRRQTKLTNWSGTQFDIKIDRTVRVLSRKDAAGKLGVEMPHSLKIVAFESENTLTNKGTEPWSKQTGLLSIWILSMFNPSLETTVVIPFNPGPEGRLGPKVNDDYFGKVPPERLIVRDDVLFFKADGRYRSKIGLSPKRAKPILGSYDAASKLLTLVQYTKPEGATDYINSMWRLQEAPFDGDAVNSYNDGPLEPGKKPLGPFYELESSSPAVALKPDESICHIHRVFHLQGPENELGKIAEAVLQVTLQQVKNTFVEGEKTCLR